MRQNNAFAEFCLKVLDIRVSLDHTTKNFANGVSKRWSREQKVCYLLFVILILLIFD